MQTELNLFFLRLFDKLDKIDDKLNLVIARTGGKPEEKRNGENFFEIVAGICNPKNIERMKNGEKD